MEFGGLSTCLSVMTYIFLPGVSYPFICCSINKVPEINSLSKGYARSAVKKMHAHALLSTKNFFDFPLKFFFCVADEIQKCERITEKQKLCEIKLWRKYYAVFKDDSGRWRAGHWVSWVGAAPLALLPEAGRLPGRPPGYRGLRAQRH